MPPPPLHKPLGPKSDDLSVSLRLDQLSKHAKHVSIFPWVFFVFPLPGAGPCMFPGFESVCVASRSSAGCVIESKGGTDINYGKLVFLNAESALRPRKPMMGHMQLWPPAAGIFGCIIEYQLGWGKKAFLNMLNTAWAWEMVDASITRKKPSRTMDGNCCYIQAELAICSSCPQL